MSHTSPSGKLGPSPPSRARRTRRGLPGVGAGCGVNALAALEADAALGGGAVGRSLGEGAEARDDGRSGMGASASDPPQKRQYCAGPSQTPWQRGQTRERAAMGVESLNSTTRIGAIRGGEGSVDGLASSVASRATGGWANRCPHVTQKRRPR